MQQQAAELHKSKTTSNSDKELNQTFTDPEVKFERISHEIVQIGDLPPMIPYRVMELTQLYKAELPNMRLESIHRIF